VSAGELKFMAIDASNKVDSKKNFMLL